MKRTAYPLFLAVVASAILLPVFALQREPIRDREAIQIRALIGGATTASSPDTSAAAPLTSAQATTAADSGSSTTAAAAATSTPQATSTAHSSSGSDTTTTHVNSVQGSSSQPAPATSVTTATDAAGQIFTSYVITNPTTSSAAAAHTNSSSDSSGGGLGTGSIIGLSVSGGIAALGIILFFVWKFTRKRFADFDDNEAIKWPELNAHNNDVHALPTNSTGRAGFGLDNDSDMNLARAPSPSGAYASSIAASSVPEVYGTGDLYAVPPLPHLNPNQPYRDEPSTYGQPAGYYDPYRGPVPNTFNDTISDGHGTESIPMTQMARMRSPGPQMAYDMQGRGSPAPQAAMGYVGMDERSITPNPGALSAERASPSPHPTYGYGTR